MTRRRKIALVSLIAAGAFVVAGSAGAATVLVFGNDPAEPQPAALDPTPTVSPVPEPTRPDYAHRACTQLFSDGNMEMMLVAARKGDPDAVRDWLDTLHRIARSTSASDDPKVNEAAGEVQQILETGGQLGDVVDELLDERPDEQHSPLLSFAAACMEGDHVEQDLIDKWAESLSG